jgi:hypothetical protein
VRCTISVRDTTLLGHRAELSLVRRVVVHDDRPVNSGDEVVLRRKIDRLEMQTSFDLHRANLQVFSYNGAKIDVEIHSRLQIDDGILFDTTISEEEVITFSPRPAVSEDAKGLVEPKDAFQFMKNLKAIAPMDQLTTMSLVLLGALVIAVNSYVGIHDQFVPEPMVWFYDHRDSDGDSEPPLQKSLMSSGVLGGALWLAMKKRLRKYMTLELHGVPARICRSDRLPAGALLRGRSRVRLENVILRVVACNMELGQYTRGSGTKKRTVSFKEPVRAVVLYDQFIPAIPAGVPVETYFDGEIDFEPMFRSLYPPQLVGKKHGLALYWEVQLIHDEFVDQEIVGPIECFPWKDFLAA